MKNIDEILARVQKLLNVEGRTPAEAAEYIRKAHDILAEYDLTIESVGQLKSDPRTSIAGREGITEAVEGKPDGWKADLLFEVARLFDARVINHSQMERTKSGRYRRRYVYELVGFGHDLEAAHYAHSFLVGEITRLAKAHVRPMWDTIKDNAKKWDVSVHEAEKTYVEWGYSHPLKAELYFIRGAAEAVESNLRVERRERDMKRRQDVEANPNALTVQKDEELNEYIGRRQYGDRWEAEKARRASTSEAYAAMWERERAAAAEKAAREAEKRARETPEQTARREAREAARRAKEEAAEDRAYQRREEARWRREQKVDHAAHRAGYAAGKDISIRPGVGAGAGRAGGIDG